LLFSRTADYLKGGAMNVALAPFIVEGFLIIVAAVFGFLNGKKSKPYGKVKLVLHLFFFAWFTMGMVFILMGTLKMMTVVAIPVFVMAVCLLVQIFAGIRMLALKEVGKHLPLVHKISATVMLLADVCALIITAIK
jgi:hypothetical protein